VQKATSNFDFFAVETYKMWRAQLSSVIREFRWALDGASSKGAITRNWIMKNYEPIKLMNPDLPFLVRESPNVDSVLHVTYDHGNERSIPLDGLSEDAVGERVKLAFDIGKTLPRWPVTAEESQHDAITDGNDHWSISFYKNLPVREIHPDQ